MKLLFLPFLILLIPVQQMPTEESDLVVVKFSWSKYRQNDLMRGVDDPGPMLNDPVSMKPSSASNEPSQLRSRRDIQERGAALVLAEQNGAKGSGHTKDLYVLRLEVKNTGTNAIKSMVWEFQPAVQPADYELPQYVCAMKAKPQESRKFELLTPSAPVKVVSADKKSQEGKVVINRIEYADGTVWKRKGWSILIPAEMTDQMGNGKCVMF